MTQFVTRNTVPANVRQGIVDTPNAPGLATLPPVSPGANQLDQMLRAFGAVGFAANAIDRHVGREVSRRKEAKAEIDSLYRGQAALDIKTALPEFMQRIENREILVPDGMSVEDFVRGYIEERVNDPSIPQAYADTYRQIALPTMAGAFVNQQQAIKIEKQNELLQLGGEAGTISNNVADFQTLLDQSRVYAPNLTETQRLNAIVVPALRNAVITGNITQFNAAKTALGGRFPQLVQALEIELNQAVTSSHIAKMKQLKDQADNALANLYNHAEETKTPINHELAAELIDTVAIDPEHERDLRDELKRRLTTQQQTQLSQVQQNITLVKSQNPSVENFTAYIKSTPLATAEKITEVDKYILEQIERAAQAGEVDRVNNLGTELSQTPKSQADLIVQQQEAVRRKQTIQGDAIISRIQAGDITLTETIVTEDGRQTTRAAEIARIGAELYAANPDDPNALRPEQVDDINRRVLDRTAFDLASKQVAEWFSGKAIVLSEEQHAKPFDEALIESGLITQNNTIADAGAMAQLLNKPGAFTTNKLRATLLANLEDVEPANVISAAQVIGSLPNKLFYEVVKHAGEHRIPMLEATKAEFNRGKLTNEESVPATIEKIRNLQSVDPQGLEPNERTTAMLKAADVNVAEETQAILDTIRMEQPQSTDTIWSNGIFFRDPKPGTQSPNLQRQIAMWYTRHFAALSNGQNIGDLDFIKQRASEYTAAQIRANVDFVRWDDRVTPVPIDNGQGLPLPAEMRWHEGYEKEARQDLINQGFDPQIVIGMRPNFDAQSRDEHGWVYIANNGEVLRDVNGKAPVYQPTTEAMKQRARFEQKLQRIDRNRLRVLDDPERKAANIFDPTARPNNDSLMQPMGKFENIMANLYSYFVGK